MCQTMPCCPTLPHLQPPPSRALISPPPPSRHPVSSRGSQSDATAGSASCSPIPDHNPDFWDANHVYVPCCTGALHAGMVNCTSPLSFDFFFSGHLYHLNFEAAVKDLFGKGLRGGAEVLLSGDSAGGMGTFINVGWLADALPWASVKGALVIDSPGRRALFAYLENGSTTTRTSPGGHPPVTPGAIGHRQPPRRARLDPYLDYGSVTSVEFMC